MATAPDITVQTRFLNLLKHSILELDPVVLNFGLYRIPNCRRTQMLSLLDDTMPNARCGGSDANIVPENAKVVAKEFFGHALLDVDGDFELPWHWRAATDAASRRYKNRSASCNEDEGYSLISSAT
jgi:hypothetical protein